MAAASLLASLARLARNSNTADFTLICGGERRQVHSTILTERSPFFDSAFERWTNGGEKEVTIKDCDMDSLNTVIDFMYGIEIPNEPKSAKEEDLNKLTNILELAERFQIWDLKRELSAIMASRIYMDNYRQFALVAEKRWLSSRPSSKIREKRLEYKIL